MAIANRCTSCKETQIEGTGKEFYLDLIDGAEYCPTCLPKLAMSRRCQNFVLRVSSRLRRKRESTFGWFRGWSWLLSVNTSK